MIRILPRDAFNDANLLKCVGKLSLLVADTQAGILTLTYDGEPFIIEQCEGDGSTFVGNIQFYVGDVPLHVSRPMNAREAWPLYAELYDIEYSVFDNDGNLTPEFKELLNIKESN